MPHLTLEYTRNLADFDPVQALAALNEAMFDSGLFGESDIKSRALGLDDFQVGVHDTPRAFVHVRVAMLSGRTDEERKALADSLLAALTPLVAGQKVGEVQLSVETAELHRPSYAKAVLHG
ncbi:5-carboxymethyl-2-hydroxymuconate Delta-isomerase [Dechloromonas sp. ARDL1]|uniref:5-carboxymethyl-2-hydroxymuconate Delta-isomerase n=1 Tax=Dechloromonas sp. ARDL1 TaxID=3322121 RepID=UPI003DA713B3